VKQDPTAGRPNSKVIGEGKNLPIQVAEKIEDTELQNGRKS